MCGRRAIGQSGFMAGHGCLAAGNTGRTTHTVMVMVMVMGTGMRGMNMVGMAAIGITVGTGIVTIMMVIIGTAMGGAAND